MRNELTSQCKRTKLKDLTKSKQKHEGWPRDLVNVISPDPKDILRSLQMARAIVPPFAKIDAWVVNSFLYVYITLLLGKTSMS